MVGLRRDERIVAVSLGNRQSRSKPAGWHLRSEYGSRIDEHLRESWNSEFPGHRLWHSRYFQRRTRMGLRHRRRKQSGIGRQVTHVQLRGLLISGPRSAAYNPARDGVRTSPDGGKILNL